MGASFIKPSAICPSMILLTNLAIDSSVYSFRLRDAASTESAIIKIAVSFVKGLGPGYVKDSSFILKSGNSFLKEL